MVYFMLVIAHGTCIKGLTAGIFFSRCIFLSIFFGLVFDLSMLLSLNSVLALNVEGGQISGVVTLFQNALRIDNKNLLFLMQFSLVSLFF